MELLIGVCKLIKNLVNQSQSTGSIFFIQGMCFAIIPFSSHYYIFDSLSRDNIGQATENGSLVLLKVFNHRSCFKFHNDHLLSKS